MSAKEQQLIKDLQSLRDRLQEGSQGRQPRELTELMESAVQELSRLLSAARKQAEGEESAASRAKARRLATFPEMNPNPVLEVGPDGGIVYYNPAAAAFLRAQGLPEDSRRFLPADWETLFDPAQQTWPCYREVTVGDRVLAEYIHGVKEFGTIRIYAADVTEHKRVAAAEQQTLAELRRRQEEITALLEASRAVLQQSNFDTGARDLFSICKNLIGATGGYVSLVNETKQENEVVYLDSEGRPCSVPEDTLMPIRGLRELSYRSGKAVYHNDFVNSEYAGLLPGGHVPIENILFAPMVVKGKTVGLLGLADKAGGFTDRDARLAEAFGELGAVALVEKWAQESMQRSHEELEERVQERTQALQEVNERLQREIGERRRAETALDEQGHIIEAFFQNTVMPLVILDKEFNFIRVNEAYARACGRRPEDFPGQQHFDLFPAEVPAIFAEVVRSKKTFETRARPFVFPDHPEWGTTYWDWNLAPIMGQKGEIDFLVLCLKDVTTEVRSRETQAQLSEIIASAPDMVGVADASGNVVYINQTGRRELLGISEKENIAGLQIKDVHTAASWELLRDEGLPTAQREGIWRGETVIRHRSGRDIPVSQVILAHKASDGTVNFFSTIARDITERKQAEEALHKLNRALRTLSACNQALVRAKEERQLLDDVCRLITEVGGYRLAWIGFLGEDEGKSIFPIAKAGAVLDYLESIKVSWDDTAYGQGPTGRAARRGTPVVGRDLMNAEDYVPWREEAKRRGFASSIALPLLDDGRVIGVLSIYSGEKTAFDEEEVALLQNLAENLSYGIMALRSREERQQAQDELHRERDFISALLDTIGALVVVLDREGKIVLFNQACEQTMGYTFAEVRDVPFWNVFVVPEELAAVEGVFHKLFVSGRSSYFENYWLTKDGQRRWIAWSNTVLTDDAGKATYVISTGIDMTEEHRLRRESEQRLAQVVQQDKLAALGEMVAGVAHEINNPNSFITYNVPLLEETWQIFEPILTEYAASHQLWRKAGMTLSELCIDMQDIIAAIRTGAERINRVVTNLKDFARLDKSAFTGPVNVNEVIEQTITIVGGQVRRTCPHIEVDLAGNLPMIRGHFHKLEQVVVNLLLNASHAMGGQEAGRITVRTRWVPRLQTVLIQVEDTGKGMAAEIVPRIFEPFFTTRRAAGGTGLGLSVSYGLVQEHHGAIGVLSRPGRGSLFTVFLPVEGKAPLGLRPQIIYLGTDRETVDYLQSRFIEMVVAPPEIEDGLQGVLASLEDYPEVDIVFIDLPLEQGDLGKLVALLRAARPLLTLIAGVAGEEGGAGLMEEGGVDFVVPRPYNRRELMELIKGIHRQRL